jgi:hypothetical protein
MQQTLADLKAAAGMGDSVSQPLTHQGGDRLGAIERQLQANQRPQRVAHHAKRAIPAACQRLASSSAISPCCSPSGSGVGGFARPVGHSSPADTRFQRRRCGSQ